MIDFETLKDKIESKINALGANFTLNFHIIAETGEYKHAERAGNSVTEYINGNFSIVNSDISNTSNGTLFATMTAYLQVLIPLEDTEESYEVNGVEVKGYAQKIKEVRAVLEDLAQLSTSETIADSDGKEFSVSTVYQIPAGGERAIRTSAGDAYSMGMNVYYIFVEGGVNSKSCTFMIDGVIFPYLMGTVNRAKTYQSNAYSKGYGEVRNAAIQSNLSFNFEFPATTGAVLSKALNCLLTGPLSRAHIFRANVLDNEAVYLVTMAESTLKLEMIKNAGFAVTFLEAPANYYRNSFDSKIYVYHVESTNAIQDVERACDILFFESGWLTKGKHVEAGFVPEGVVKGSFIVSTGKIYWANELNPIQGEG